MTLPLIFTLPLQDFTSRAMEIFFFSLKKFFLQLLLLLNETHVQKINI